ncbi:hypothetical protein AAF712_016783, partial [Marasmius tenuissimus]
REKQWLTQAGHIFSALGIARTDWEDHSIVTGFDLELTFGEISPPSLEGQNDGWYLFLLPPPQLPDGNPDFDAWLRGDNLYYWSSDPKGSLVISDQDCIAFGLPSPTSCVQIHCTCWSTEAYDFVYQWQEAKGFDPTTMEYARSLGYPMLENASQDESCVEDFDWLGGKREGLYGVTDSPVWDDLMDVDPMLADTRAVATLIVSSSCMDMDVDIY